MRKYNYFLTTLMLLALNLNLANAQENNEIKTLFGKPKPLNLNELGFYLAPSISGTQLDGANTALFNLRAGLSYKENIAFGAFFNTSLNRPIPVSETVKNVYLDYWSVGGFTEYTLFSKNIFHLTFPLYVGYGEVEMDNEEGYTELGEAKFFTVEPSAKLEVNLYKNLRFNLGTGYRFVGDMNYRNFNQSDISGLTGYIGLKFGLFR